MHLLPPRLPKAITSTQPHLSVRANAIFTIRRRAADVLNIFRSVDCLSWSSTHINALSLSPASSFFSARGVYPRWAMHARGRHLYVPLVDCNRALRWEHVLRQPVLGAILLRLMPIPIGAIQSSMIELLEAP
jgi:hypothetical protein